MIDLQFLPKVRSNVQHQIIDGESVILDRDRGVIHQLNETASFIWQCCDGSNSIHNIVILLTDHFSTTEEIANNDVINVITNFKELELLE